MEQITIIITESIRIAPYETIKPSISMSFDIPLNTDIEEFYKRKYRIVKRIWNLHLYNLLYNTSRRHKAETVFGFAEDLILKNEGFPTFKNKGKKDENSG